jgi:hypothetical protein
LIRGFEVLEQIEHPMLRFYRLFVEEEGRR